MATQEPRADAAVREASDRFYDALERMANGDAGPMMDIWSHEDDVTTMHPIGGREVGWDAVREPWENIAAMSEDGKVTRTDQLVRVFGELAYELTTEEASMTMGGERVSFERRATNVYRLEDGEWKIVHHHVDQDDAFVETVAKLQEGA